MATMLVNMVTPLAMAACSMAVELLSHAVGRVQTMLMCRVSGAGEGGGHAHVQGVRGR